MEELNRYSVQDSKFSTVHFEGRECIRKETRLNVHLGIHWCDLEKAIIHYVTKLTSAGIPVPEIYKSEANQERLIYICEFKGPNILQYMRKIAPNDLLPEKKVLDRIFSILRKAQNARLNFDPHIKNFVWNGVELAYVDFTPPWVDSYYDVRLSLACEHEKKILKDFFSCMEPQQLGYHFAADFLKMDPIYMSTMPRLFSILGEHNLIQGNFDAFVTRVNKIKEIEQQREREKLFLL